MKIQLILVATILIIAIFLSYYQETFVNEPIFQLLDTSYVQSFLLNDPDQYVRQLSSADLYARQANDHTDYLKKSSEDVIKVPLEKQYLLQKAISHANQFFSTFENSYIQKDEMQQIPWKLAFTKGYYENGLPHTRMDIIFLPISILNQSISSITQTLIHEKVHLHQRIYKARYQNILLSKNYKIIGTRNQYHYVRSNPDVDEYIYYHPNNSVMMEKYRTLTPKNIQDTEKLGMDAKYEHPFEEIAYKVAEKYSV